MDTERLRKIQKDINSSIPAQKGAYDPYPAWVDACSYGVWIQLYQQSLLAPSIAHILPVGKMDTLSPDR